MNPQEKAKELVEKFEPLCDYEVGHIHQQKENAKKCARLCINEIVKERRELGFDSPGFWKQVKQEINNL